MTGPRYLTKSRFKIAVECPTKLFYTGKRTEYADSMEGNEFLAMLAEGGYQVGALAKLRYPEGIEIREKSHAAAEAETRDYLSRDRIVLFEPAIRCGNFFIRIDILVKKGRTFELIEVKAKSYDSTNPDFYNKSGSIKPGVLPYFQDAAFQTWVLQQAYPDATITTSLMMPDKSQTAPVDGINQMFRLAPDGEVCVQMPVAVNGELLAKTLLAKYQYQFGRREHSQNKNPISRRSGIDRSGSKYLGSGIFHGSAYSASHWTSLQILPV